MSGRLIRDSVLATYGLAAQGLARFASTVLIGRAFGADVLGEVSALLAAGVLLSLLWPAGAGLAASTYVARLRSGDISSNAIPALNRQTGLSLIVIGLVAGLIGWIVTQEAILTAGSVLFAIAYSGYVYVRGVQLGLGRTARIAGWDTISGVAMLAGLGLFIAVDAAAWVLLPLAVGYGLFVAGCWPRIIDGNPIEVGDRELSRFVGANSLAQVASGGILPLAMLAAQGFGSSFQAGLFAAAFALATPASMLGQSMQQVLVPYFSRGGHTPNRVRAEWRVVGVSGVVLTAVFAFVIALADVLIAIFFGPEFESADWTMRWLLLAVLVATLSLIPAAALIASGRPRSFVAATICGFLTAAIAMVVLGPWLGTDAALIGYGLGASFTTVLTYYIFWSRSQQTVPVS